MPLSAFVLLLPLAAVDPPASTPALPLAPRRGWMTSREPGTPTTLYINYDGAVLQSGCGNDPTRNCSTLADLFQGYVGPFGGNELQKMAILQATRKGLADFGINVVVDRPPDHIEYSMVVYGVLGPQSFAGVAPYIDCEDVWPGDTSFSEGFTSSNTGATIILQEAAHTWGLEHVDAETDILNPFNVSGITQQFQDECFRIVANTDLEPSPGVCNIIHTRFCDVGFQNAWRELDYLFGASTPDTRAPTIGIVNPPPDAVYVAPVNLIPLMGKVTDDQHPQVYGVELMLDGEVVLEDTAGSITELITFANLQNTPPGDYEITVRITDGGGNQASDTVRFTVLPGGDQLPDDSEGGPQAGFQPNGCRMGERSIPFAGLLLLLGLTRRRWT